MEDLLQEDVERWLGRHGKKLAANNTNHQKRLLRKWFQGYCFFCEIPRNGIIKHYLDRIGF